MDANRLFFKYCVHDPIVWMRGEPVGSYLRKLRKTQWGPKDIIEKIQGEKLVPLLGFARANVAFYRERLPDSGAQLTTASRAIADVPFLTKADIQENPQLLRAPLRGPLTVKTTGGSTGQAVTIYKSKDASGREMAASWRGYEWAGVRIAEKQARFWGIPLTPKDRLRARLIDAVANRRRCSAFAFSDADLDAYTRTLNRFRPRYFYGYVSMLHQYATYVLQNGIKLQFRPTAIITTSEVLTPVHRAHLEEAFSCKVYNEYGCGELGTIAHECESGSLHVNAENLLVEIFDGERPCQPGERGEIVVTELNNYAMPLIRYRVGDFGIMSQEQCSCGRALPVLKEVSGRAYDLVYNREGRLFHAEFFMYIFEEVKRKGLGIRSFQVVQESYEKFSVLVVPDRNYGDETRALIRQRFREGYGDYAAVEFTEVNQIARRASGKMQLIVGLPPQHAVTRPLYISA